MISLNRKADCSGCGACVQKCPKSCIVLQTDEEGFLYPSVDENSCVNCGQCSKVCGILSPYLEQIPKYVYGAQIKDSCKMVVIQNLSLWIYLIILLWVLF